VDAGAPGKPERRDKRSAVLLSDRRTPHPLGPQLGAGGNARAEARYLRSYDGLGLDLLMGQALFIGPTFYARFSDRFWMGGAWNIQVAGRTGNESGALDLTNFERHQAKVRFGYNF
jgi:hypothetical protein